MRSAYCSAPIPAAVALQSVDVTGDCSIALYAAGVTSTLSPCVLPLVPGYLGVLVDGTEPCPSRFQRVALFAIGALATFVALGGIVAAIRLPLSATIEWLQRLAGLGLIALGTMMILGARGRVKREFRLVRALPKQPHARALLLGIGCGAAWSPCVGPLLGAALTAAAASGSPWRGSWPLFAFGCGVLTPFCIVASVRLPRLGRRARALGRRMSAASAVVMVALGALLLAGWYDAFVQRLDIGT